MTAPRPAHRLEQRPLLRRRIRLDGFLWLGCRRRCRRLGERHDTLDDPPGFHQYRDSRGREIDLVLECPGGRLICVEIKAGSTVRPADARTLGWFRDLTGDRFELGIVLYAGRHPVALADRIVALPLSYLWKL